MKKRTVTGLYLLIVGVMAIGLAPDSVPGVPAVVVLPVGVASLILGIALIASGQKQSWA